MNDKTLLSSTDSRPAYGLIAVLNLIGILIVLSWLQTSYPFWADLNSQIFHAFNATLTPENPAWVTIVAALNNRIFDALSFLLLLVVFIIAIRKSSLGLWHWLGVGLTMLITAGIISIFTNNLPYSHPSPSLYFHLQGEPVNFISQMVDFKTKDRASNSFPGDHALMLMIFAAFMMRYADRFSSSLAIIMIFVLSAPRMIAGGHWFEDIYMASLAIALIILPWVLLTPLSDRCVNGIESFAKKLTRSSR